MILRLKTLSARYYGQVYTSWTSKHTCSWRDKLIVSQSHFSSVVEHIDIKKNKSKSTKDFECFFLQLWLSRFSSIILGDKFVVIAPCRVQYGEYFPSFSYFPTYFTSLKSENICQYCRRSCTITTLKSDVSRVILLTNVQRLLNIIE